MMATLLLYMLTVCTRRVREAIGHRWRTKRIERTKTQGSSIADRVDPFIATNGTILATSNPIHMIP